MSKITICDYCGSRWLYPISAAMCCDSAAHCDDEPNIHRAAD